MPSARHSAQVTPFNANTSAVRALIAGLQPPDVGRLPFAEPEGHHLPPRSEHLQNARKGTTEGTFGRVNGNRCVVYPVRPNSAKRRTGADCWKALQDNGKARIFAI